MPSDPGLRSIVVPANTSEYHTMLQAIQAHHNAIHGQVTDVAATLRRILPGVIAARGGTRGGVLGGAEAKYKARRALKPLMDIGALNNEIARLTVVAYGRYTDIVVNAAMPAAAASTFNVDA